MDLCNLNEELASCRKSIALLEKRIEEYEATEEKLRRIISLQKKRENILRSLIEIVPAPIILIDQDKKVVGINRYVETRLSKSRTQVIGKKFGEVFNCADFIYDDGPACNICPINSAVTTVLDTDIPSYDVKMNMCTSIGSESVNFNFCANLFPIVFNDEKYIILSMNIIDEEMGKTLLRQEIEKMDRLRNEYFANISHELKTPLNIILGVIALFEGYNNNDQSFHRYVQIMKQNSFRMLKLINNIVDVAKMDLGFFDLKLKNQNIVRIIGDTVFSTMEYAKAKGIDIQFMSEIKEKIIACDEEKIERVLLNLLSNSIKYIKGPGTITVSIYNREGSICISVKDTGIGIPSDILEEIFKLFRQVDMSNERSYEGSGVGLFIVKSIVDLHNGKIRVESEVGKGSESILELPARTVCWPESLDTISEHNLDNINIEFADI